METMWSIYTSSLPFLLQDWLYGFSGLFTDTFEHTRFYSLVFLFFSYFVVVGFRAVDQADLCWLLSARENSISYRIVKPKPVSGICWNRYWSCLHQFHPNPIPSWAYPAININNCLQVLTKDICIPADIARSALETIVFYCFMGYISALTYYL